MVKYPFLMNLVKFTGLLRRQLCYFHGNNVESCFLDQGKYGTCNAFGDSAGFDHSERSLFRHWTNVNYFLFWSVKLRNTDEFFNFVAFT